MTAHGTSETAIEATKFGAYDYLVKPFEMEELLEVVERAWRRAASCPSASSRCGGDVERCIVGNSRAMQNIYKEVERIAPKPVNVLIRGETGTGKD